MNLFFDFSGRNPYKIVVIAVVVTIVMGFGATQISSEEEREEFLPEDYTSYKVSRAYENSAGELITETIVVEGGDLESAESFKRLMELTSELSNHEKLENYVSEARSYPRYLVPIIENQLGNWKDLPEKKLEMSIGELLNRPEIQEQVSRYLSEDRKVTVVTLIINNKLSESTLEDKTDTLQRITDNYDSEYDKLSLSNTGTLSRDGAMKNAMMNDLQILIPLAAAFIIGILYLTFRRIFDTLLPFLVLGLGVVWMIGTMGLAGVPFYSNFTIIVPILLGIGIDYAIHLLNRYYEERSEGSDPETSALLSVKTVGVAILLTAVTTSIGFSSFGISDMAPIKSFGFVAGAGVLYVFILANTVLPSLLTIRDSGKEVEQDREGSWGEDRLGKALGKLEGAIFGRSKALLAGAGLVTVLAMVPIMGLSTTMSSDIMMPDGAEAVEVQNTLEDHFGGYGSGSKAYVIVEGEIFSPEALRGIAELQQSVMSDPKNDNLIVDTSSIANLIKRKSGGKIPTRQELSQVLKGLESKSGGMYNRLVLSKHKTVVYFTFGTDTMEEDRDATKLLRDSVESFGEESDAEIDLMMDGEPAVSGMPVILSDISDNIKPDLVSSILLAIFLVVVVLSIVFKSLSLGLIGSVPVSLTLAWELGLLGALGVPLNVMNMLVSAIAIGIGVDFSIHVIHRFEEEKREKSLKNAISDTVQSTGRAILSAAATTIGVFVIISFSSTPMLVSFGWLSAVVISFSLVGSLIILPLILFHYAKYKEGTN